MLSSLTRTALFLEEKIEKLSRFLGFLAIFLLVVMMAFTVLDIILRATISKPIPGDVELIEMLMVGAGFLGLAWCATLNMHIKVDLLVARFPKRVQRIFDCFNYIIALVMCTVFAWRNYIESFFIKDMNTTTEILGIYIYPFYWIIAFSYAVLCLVIVTRLMRAIIGGER